MDALDLLSSENYITVNKTLIKEMGLENAIIFGVLCGYQRGYGTEEFYKEQEKIIEDTGLSEYLVRKSIKELIDLDYIIVVKKGMPAKYHYRINIELLTFKILSSSGAKFDTTSGCKDDTANKNNNKNDINNINNIYKEKENIKEKSTRFQKPTLEELQSYINEKGYHFSAEAFIDYYDSVGWKIGKCPMKSWKSACNTWERKYKENNSYKNPYSSGDIPRETAYPDLKKNYL